MKTHSHVCVKTLYLFSSVLLFSQMLPGICSADDRARCMQLSVKISGVMKRGEAGLEQLERELADCNYNVCLAEAKASYISCRANQVRSAVDSAQCMLDHGALNELARKACEQRKYQLNVEKCNTEAVNAKTLCTAVRD